MERRCFSFKIKPGSFTEYKRRHDEIWPELVEELTAAGLSNYSLSWPRVFWRHGGLLL